MIGRSGFIKGLGAAAAVLGAKGVAAKGKKKKRCPKPPVCPKSCTFIFYEPTNGKYCGTGNTLQRNPGCVPCTKSSDCVNAGFQHCLNSFETVSNGQISYFTGACGGPYEFGVCGNVSACIT